MKHRTVSATEFKAKCLALLDEVEESGGTITLTKTGETDWNDVIPSVRQFLKDYLEEGKPVINE